MRVAVIDVGTNSVRLLVADREDGALLDVERDLIITRLGEGVDRERRLRAQPTSRTIDAIATYVERARAAGAERIRIVATSAVRDATNKHAFLHGVRARTGIDADVLSGDEEAQLGFAGATMSIAGSERYLICDIGGGSTELVLGATEAERFISLDIGAVRLTERHVRGDPPSDEQLAAIREDARAHLERARPILGETSDARLVGLAGTITTVAAVDLGLDGYDRRAIHGHVLRYDGIAAIRALLASMTSDARRRLPAMPPGREDVIVAGILILEETMDVFDVRDCVVSETDILDGTAMRSLGG